MEGSYSIGYVRDSDKHFSKIWDAKGYTRKWATAEDCKAFIEEDYSKYSNHHHIYKIMRGREVLEVIDKSER